MKKHKVEIPEGHEIESTTTESYTDNDGKKCYPRVIIKLKPIKKQLPKTWEEYCEITDHGMWICTVTIPNNTYHVQMEALYKLLKVRDHYNDGWEPDWTDGNQPKFVM